jgi:hypothetical protein
MTERETDLGDELIGAMDEALAYARGNDVEVRETRVDVTAAVSEIVATALDDGAPRGEPADEE